MERYTCGGMCFFGPSAYRDAVKHYRITEGTGISRVDDCRVEEGDGIRATLVFGEKLLMPWWYRPLATFA